MAFINSGYGCTDTNTYIDLHDYSGTCSAYFYAFDPAIFEERDGLCLLPYLADIAPWLFKFDEPWKAPIHYPPAPMKIIGRSEAVTKPLTVYKQPVARSGFRRGQRR